MTGRQYPIEDYWREPLKLWALRVAFQLTGDAAVAEDLLNQTYVEKLSKSGTKSANKTFFRQALRWTWGHMRPRPSPPVIPFAFLQPHDLQKSAEMPGSTVEIVDFLTELLGKLSCSELTLVRLRFVEQLPWAAVASALRVSEAAVKGRWTRLREKLVRLASAIG